MKTYRTHSFTAIKSQQGWTFWSLLFTLSVIGFFAYVGMQLVPVYSTNDSISKAIRQTAEEVDPRKVTRREIINKLNKQLYLDGNHELLDFKKDLKVTRNKSKFEVGVNYDREIPLFANLSIVARFSPKVECDLIGNCKK